MRRLLIIGAVVLVACGGGSGGGPAVSLGPATSQTRAPGGGTGPAPVTTSTSAAGSVSSAPTGSASSPPGGGLVLAADGLGIVAFGTSETDTVVAISGVLGPPDRRGTGCESAGPTARSVQWKELSIQLLRGVFQSWSVAVTGTAPPSVHLATDKGIGVGASVAALKAAYPDVQFGRTAALGPDGFTLMIGEEMIVGAVSSTEATGTVTSLATSICD